VAPPNSLLSDSASTSGKPLWKLNAAAAFQCAASRRTGPDLLDGDGSCQFGATMSRCGTSRMPVWDSVIGS